MTKDTKDVLGVDIDLGWLDKPAEPKLVKKEAKKESGDRVARLEKAVAALEARVTTLEQKKGGLFG